MKDYLNVISLGAGKQSSYMLLNALEGKFDYYPDLAIFSDTGCEPKYVYDYLDWLKGYVWERYKFEIVIVSNGNLMQDVIDYIDGKRDRVAQLPFYTNGGILMRQCTYEYKIMPLRKYLTKVRDRKRVRLWIGISLDEVERIKDSNVKYIEHYYPLVKNGIRIDGIINWFKINGLREPGKSACLICPFHSFSYWSVFKKQYGDEFDKVCDFDDKIRDYPKLRNKCYLSNKVMALRDIDFTQHPSLFPDMIEECEGLCGL